MKRSLFIACVAFSISFSSIAQLAVTADYSKQILTINGTPFTNQSTLADYEKVLGKAERVEKIGGKDKIFAYDASGISLSLKAGTNVVQEIFITYVSDGDRKVARGKFAGTIKVNGGVVEETTKSDDVAKTTGLDMKTIMPGYFIAQSQSMFFMIYYKDGKLSQLGFSFE